MERTRLTPWAPAARQEGPRTAQGVAVHEVCRPTYEVKDDVRSEMREKQGAGDHLSEEMEVLKENQETLRMRGSVASRPDQVEDGAAGREDMRDLEHRAGLEKRGPGHEQSSQEVRRARSFWKAEPRTVL